MGKLYYNGVLLPQIPADVLAEYPYAWIRNNKTSGYYDLIMSNTPYYYATSIKEGAGKTNMPYYRVPIATAESAVAWTSYGTHTFSSWGITDRPVLWSNHDIPNGSATAEDIYFHGSEPLVMEYVISTETMLNIANAIRAKIGSSDYFTPTDMATAIKAIETMKDIGMECTYGTVMFAEKLTIGNTLENAYTVEHGLGKVPNIFIFAYCNKMAYTDAKHLKLFAILQNPAQNSYNVLSVAYSSPTSNSCETGTVQVYNTGNNANYYFGEPTITESIAKITGVNDQTYVNASYNSANYSYFWIAMRWDIA